MVLERPDIHSIAQAAQQKLTMLQNTAKSNKDTTSTAQLEAAAEKKGQAEKRDEDSKLEQPELFAIHPLTKQTKYFRFDDDNLSKETSKSDDEKAACNAQEVVAFQTQMHAAAETALAFVTTTTPTPAQLSKRAEKQDKIDRLLA
jgi:hypothetical protein